MQWASSRARSSSSGELDQRFGAAFEGLALTAGDGMTELTGSLADQAQLQGVLRQLFDLGLVVVSFTTAPSLEPAQQGCSPG